MNTKVVIFIALVLILFVFAVIISKNIKTTTETTGGGTTNVVTNGLAGVYDFVAGLFGKKDPYVTTGCDPNKPGYNLDGLYDNNCQ